MKRLILLAGILLAGCIPNTYCPEKEVSRAAEEYSDILDEFADVLNLAGSTPRMNLAPVISQLQEVRREASNLDVPECLNETHELTLLGFESYIDGYLSFMGQEPDSLIDSKFREGDTYITDANSSLRAVKLCMPDCKPK